MNKLKQILLKSSQTCLPAKEKTKIDFQSYLDEYACRWCLFTASCDDEGCVAGADDDADVLVVDKVNFVVAAAAVGSFLHLLWECDPPLCVELAQGLASEGSYS